MSWLSDWFRRDKNKIIIGLVVKGLKLFIGRVAGDLYDIVEREVRFAESSGKKGAEKATMVLKNVRKQVEDQNLPEYFLRLLMETAVIVVNNQ